MLVSSTKKAIILFGASTLLLCLGPNVFAASGSGTTLGTIAQNVLASVPNIARLIYALAYIAGVGLGVAGILQLKAHKDNPTQTPVSKGIALLFVAAALIFLPSIFKTTGSTMGISSSAGVTGITNIGS